jgi:hypothetical protein
MAKRKKMLAKHKVERTKYIQLQYWLVRRPIHYRIWASMWLRAQVDIGRLSVKQARKQGLYCIIIDVEITLQTLMFM